MSSLNLPPSKGFTVRLSILDAGHLTIPTSFVVKQPVPGHERFHGVCYSFLIENDNAKKKVLFDLGMMKTWREKFVPSMLEMFEAANAETDIPKDVADQLKDNNLPLESIDAIIWSHSHLDHIGDSSLFPKTTDLIVGPGFKSNKAAFPGYPLNPDSVIPHDAYEGRQVVELDFGKSTTEIGGFKALDYFEDGSFYLLKVTGHTDDHIVGLARTSDDKFVFLGADTAHHAGEFRPTPELPLPDSITPSPFEAVSTTGFCLGSIFDHIHAHRSEDAKDGYRTTPFYELNPALNADLDLAQKAVEKMEAFDAREDVFVIVAHDTSILDMLPLYPKTFNGWEKTDVKNVGRWRFLKDFEIAVKLRNGESQ
ncbi:metallo-beta-lactamase superfamily protein [Atractiella rhizophila]|nr:metallo-beta-lactamase superfamily protein [Atractiella rhizophila]